MDDRSIHADLRRFYKQLIKAPITLQTRNQLADIYAGVLRKSNAQAWEQILKHKSLLLRALNQLQEEGYVEVVTSNSIEELCAELLEKGSIFKGDLATLPPDGKVEIPDIQDLKSVQKISNDRMLNALASLYLGAPAHVYDCQAWWHFPVNPDVPSSNAQLWHRDRDDLAVLKLFAYVTDVDMSSGPHAFVPRSHTDHGLKTILTKDDISNPKANGLSHCFMSDQDLQQLGYRNVPKIWQGPAGTCFLEDTRGLHKALIPTGQPRLIFSLVWTLSPGFRFL